jgi:copper ion binding protein
MSKETRTLTVSGMSCSHCEYVIKKAVGTLNGVEKVTVNLESKKVAVDYETDKISLELIKEVIEDQGYDVV